MEIIMLHYNHAVNFFRRIRRPKQVTVKDVNLSTSRNRLKISKVISE
ncbi:unnamed protein product [Tenebrio molitor]|nr:unnamed protein product [Tenebrio molitor]